MENFLTVAQVTGGYSVLTGTDDQSKILPILQFPQPGFLLEESRFSFWGEHHK